jgi:hypothetical protein
MGKAKALRAFPIEKTQMDFEDEEEDENEEGAKHGFDNPAIRPNDFGSATLQSRSLPIFLYDLEAGFGFCDWQRAWIISSNSGFLVV